MNAKELRLDQLDAVLLGAASHPLPPRPPVGWLRAIRETLGMTSVALGQRLGITASGVRKLEQAEAADAITLATLRPPLPGKMTPLHPDHFHRQGA